MTKATTSIREAQDTPAAISHTAMAHLHSMSAKHLSSQENFKAARAHNALSKGYSALHAGDTQTALTAAGRAENHHADAKVYAAGLKACCGAASSPMAKAASEGPNVPRYGVAASELNHEPKMHHTLPSGEKVHPQSDAAINDLHHRVTIPSEAAKDHGIAHLHQVMSGLDVSVRGRTKDAPSIGGKIARKGYGVERMGDLVGLRVTVHNPAHFKEAQSRLQAHMKGEHPLSGKHAFEVHSEEDSVKKPMDSGYRSVHYNAKSLGTATEIQLRQPHHTVWADYCHDNFYKDHALKAKLTSTGHMHDLSAVQEAGMHYSKAVADHLDKTNGVKGPNAPKTPPILEKHGLGFTWHKLN